ncbi:WD repeat-containing protein 43, partial [Perkinsus olseni]
EKSRSSGSASMAALARQGLAGGDTMALDRVLHTTNNAVMAATARDITGPEAAQILSHICMALDKSPARAVVLSEWTRNLLLVHAGYLSGHPEDTRAVIAPLLASFHQRTAYFSALSKLHGRVQAVIDVCTTQQRAAKQTPPEPLAKYIESPGGGDDAAYDNDVAMDTEEDEDLDAMASDSDDDGDDEGSDSD